MSKYRRRLMMAQKKEEPIAWDYEWYPPQEMPSWITINSNAHGEMGANYYRVFAATGPASNTNRNFMNIGNATLFPTSKSYIMEIDLEDRMARTSTSASSGSYSFALNKNGSSASIGQLIYIKRTGTSTGQSGFYKCCFTSAPSTNTSYIIPDSLRYKIRFFFDNANAQTTASVGNVKYTVNYVGRPGGLYNRNSITGTQYLDIYSIKIKVIDNE